MGYTKVSLKPLQEMKQLKHLGNANHADYERINNMVTFTFQIANAEGDEVLQDLSIIFERKPSVYISEPYTYNNAAEVQE